MRFRRLIKAVQVDMRLRKVKFGVAKEKSDVIVREESCEMVGYPLMG